MARIVELRDDPARLCRRAQAGIDVLASHPVWSKNSSRPESF
jgi:hypothetical protein